MKTEFQNKHMGNSNEGNANGNAGDKPLGLRKRQKIERRNEIILATVELIAERGYEESHIDIIAERANLSVPTIYRYFQTKRDIALAAIEAEVADIRLSARRLIDSDWSDPIEIFSQVILSRVEGMLDESRGDVVCRLWKVTYAEAIKSPAGDDFADKYFTIVTEALNSQFIRLSELTKERGHFDASVDSGDVATIFMFLAHGLFRRWLLGHGLKRDQAIAMIRRQVTLIFNGLNTERTSLTPV